MISPKKILLVDDNVDLRELLVEILEAANYEVLQAKDGAEALNFIEKEEKIYCIVSDVVMPNISGKMFLKIIRERGLKIPLIFISGEENVVETVEVHKLGAQALLVKPFENKELLDKLLEVESYYNIINRPEAETELEDYYTKVDIDDFVTGKKILYPVFLKLSSSKFVKIAHTGEDLDQTKIDNIKKHNVEYFYLLNADFENYLKRNIAIARSLLGFREIKDAKKREFFVAITKNLVEYEFHRDLNSENLAMSIFAIHNTLKLVSEKKDFFKLLQTLQSVSPGVVEHSVLVSLIASAIALESEEFNSKTVDVVAMAALFHDFGLKELPKEILEKEEKDYTPEELKLYQTHTQLGCQLMASVKNVPEAVSQAILHHHENCDGSGFPFGIGRAKIHPIARIIRIADYIAYEWTKKDNFEASFGMLLQPLKDKTDIFDKDYVKVTLELVKSFNPLFKTKF